MTVITTRSSMFGSIYPDVPENEVVLLLSNAEYVDDAGRWARRDYGQVGWPKGLGILYAQNPLATLVGLLATGIGVGWFICGRQNRSGGMSGFAGTPEEHSAEYDRLNARRRKYSRYSAQALELDARMDQETRWFRRQR